MTNLRSTALRHLRSLVQRSIGILLSILAAVVVGSLIMLWYKQNPVEIYGLVLKGAVGSQRSVFISLQRATPLIFTAVASTIAFRTGIFNIGVEGQFFIGAIAGTFQPGPSFPPSFGRSWASARSSLPSWPTTLPPTSSHS